MSVVAVHLGPEHGTGYLTPADELDEIELGERADYWMTIEGLASIYSSPEDRAQSMTLHLIMLAGLAGEEQ